MDHTDELARFTFTRWTTRSGDDAMGALSEQHQAGRRQGWTIAFYSNGQKACEGQFRGGVEDGWWVFWNRDGAPCAAVEFRQGDPVRTMAEPTAPTSTSSGAASPLALMNNDVHRMLKAG